MTLKARLRESGARALNMRKASSPVAPENRATIARAAARGDISSSNLAGGLAQLREHLPDPMTALSDFSGLFNAESTPRFYNYIKRPIQDFVRWNFGGAADSPWRSHAPYARRFAAQPFSYKDVRPRHQMLGPDDRPVERQVAPRKAAPTPTAGVRRLGPDQA